MKTVASFKTIDPEAYGKRESNKQRLARKLKEMLSSGERGMDKAPPNPLSVYRRVIE